MKKTNYSDKLKHPKWQKKRLKILERDDFTCQFCNDTETELHVHHTEYNGQPWEIDDEYLITLCKYCHEFETMLNENGSGVKKLKALGDRYFVKTITDRFYLARIYEDKIQITNVIPNVKGFIKELNSFISENYSF